MWKSQFTKVYCTSSYIEKTGQDLYLWSCFFWKPLGYVHSKNKSHNCPICDLSFSRIDILDRHANHFHGDRMSKNMLIFWLWFFWKSQFEKAYWTSSYKETLNKISICDHAYFLKKVSYKNTLNLFIQNKIAQFVI